MTQYQADSDLWGQPGPAAPVAPAPPPAPAAPVAADPNAAAYGWHTYTTGPDGKPLAVAAPTPAVNPYTGAPTGPQGDQALWPAGSPQAAPPPPVKNSDALGVYIGATKPMDNAATWMRDAVGAIPGIGKPAVNFIDSLPNIEIGPQGVSLDHKSLADTVDAHQRGVHALEDQGYRPTLGGKIVGGLLGTAPALIATKNPMVVGGLSGLLTTDDPHDAVGAARDTALGVIGGKVTSGALNVAGHALSPVVAPTAQKLIDAGVKLSPGQIMGGGWRTIEDGLSHLPFIGTAIKGAQGEATSSLNKVALNRALAPVGETLPDHIGIGNEAIDYIADRLGQKYRDLLPNVPDFHLDRPFVDDLKGIYQNGVDGVKLGPAQDARLQGIIKDTLFSRIGDDGSITGKNMQAVDSTLGTMAKGFSSGQNSFDDQTLGRAIGSVQTSLRDLFARANPSAAADLAKINEGWANFARVRSAASSLGAKEGVFSAPQLQNAVKAADKSAGKGDFAKGRALMQDLSTPAHALLPSTVNDSGTGTRGLMDAAVLGAMSGHGGEHAISAHVILPAAALMAPYSAKGLPIVRGLLSAPRGPALQLGGGLLRGAARPAGAVGGLLGPGQYPSSDTSSASYGLLSQ